jgi:hypothetical protein
MTQHGSSFFADSKYEAQLPTASDALAIGEALSHEDHVMCAEPDQVGNGWIAMLRWYELAPAIAPDLAH